MIDLVILFLCPMMDSLSPLEHIKMTTMEELTQAMFEYSSSIHRLILRDGANLEVTLLVKQHLIILDIAYPFRGMAGSWPWELIAMILMADLMLDT